MIYALIKSSIVQNVISAEVDFINRLVNAGEIDEGVLIEEGAHRPNIGDTYSNGSFIPTIPSLAKAKEIQLTRLKYDVDSFVDSRYDLKTRVQLMNLYVLAKFNNLTNRAAYLETGLAWASEVLAYCTSIVLTIQSQTSIQDTMAVTWDVVNNVGTDPKITAAAAIVIPD